MNSQKKSHIESRKILSYVMELQMKKTLFILLSFLLTCTALAKKNCTNQPEQNWMRIEDFKKMAINQGYTIRKFKQPGSCYEIYGRNKSGQRVEVYFNPVDGSVVKSKLDG
jgi:hypothetical protein